MGSRRLCTGKRILLWLTPLNTTLQTEKQATLSVYGSLILMQWVSSALKIAKVESGYQCNATGPKTRHGHAKGIFQLIDSSAQTLGFDPKRMYDCNENIAAGVAHMKVCISYGVKDPRGMAACHVAGWNHWNVKLARQHERYKQQYIRMATA